MFFFMYWVGGSSMLQCIGEVWAVGFAFQLFCDIGVALACVNACIDLWRGELVPCC